MSDLIAFLRARLDEREQALRRLIAAKADGGWELWGEFGNLVAKVANFHRMLAEVAANRVLIELHGPGPDEPWGEDPLGNVVMAPSCRADEARVPCSTLRALAQPYADHPDFDPAWRVATL